MDREEYSLKNEWIDEDGNVYFIFIAQPEVHFNELFIVVET